MAINRVQYPITLEEATRVLRALADEISRDAVEERRFGDTRPEVLKWAADRLVEMDSQLDDMAEELNAYKDAED